MTRKKVTKLGGEVSSVQEFTNALTRATGRLKEMFDSEIASKNNMKILEVVAKLAGECMLMERDKRPYMTDIAERLRMLRKKLHQDQAQQPVGLFSWARGKRPAPPAIVIFPAVKTSPSDLFCRRFTHAEMLAATNNFDQLLMHSCLARGSLVEFTVETLMGQQPR
jgi:hypothetical protein